MKRVLTSFGRRSPCSRVCDGTNVPQQAAACSGRSGTWNRVRYASTFASVALPTALILLAPGCNFTDFSKTKSEPVTEPACLPSPAIGGAPGVLPVAHWTFDEGLNDGKWHDKNGAHPISAAADPIALADADAGAAAPADHPRINGQGQSLRLNGHQFVRSAAAAESELVPDEFTITAWISLPARVFTSEGVPFAWPILSTLGDPTLCDGYQLEIRFQGAPADPELVLSYQKPATEDEDAGAAGCRVVSLRAPVEIPSWATGTGRWHHVAGTLAQFGDGRLQLALYWDGKRIQAQDPLEPISEATSQIEGGARAFFVGASALTAASAAQTKFTGFIDDIAVFDRPLTEQELHEFVLASTTREGPSNCRWRASEQWDETAFYPSYAQWSSSSTEEVSVIIDDQEWGAGAIDARIEPPRDIQLYDKAHVEGDFPTGQGFQFTLASGDNYCTWTYLGRGRDKYEIDLTNPVSCVSTTCEVDLHRVDRASITSEWAVPTDDAAKRPPGKAPFSVRRLDFAPASGGLPDWTGYGGAYALRGYCWRLQAYEPESAAHWNRGHSPWTQVMSATLTGLVFSGTRVTADFGERGLDISGCDSATLDATLQPTGSSAHKYALAVQDVNGSWLSYDLRLDSTTGLYIVDEFDRPSSQSAGDDNFVNFPTIDIRRIRLLGLQKPWNYSGSLDVTIRKLSLVPDKCERPGPG